MNSRACSRSWGEGDDWIRKVTKPDFRNGGKSMDPSCNISFEIAKKKHTRENGCGHIVRPRS